MKTYIIELFHYWSHMSLPKKNLVLSVFSTSSLAPAQQWANSFFDDETVVLSVPGSSGSEFRQRVIRWCRTGDLFQAALKELAPRHVGKFEIKNRILVTFSVGWSAADEIFKFTSEVDKLNAYILLDGCHTQALDHWKNFALKAAVGDAVFIMAHSSIIPPFISAEKTNTILFKYGQDILEYCSSHPKIKISLPEYITNYKIEPPIQISLGAAGNLPKISKMFHQDPLIKYDVVGGMIKLHYAGNDRPDHVYICNYVQKRMYKLLSQLI